MRAAVLTGIGRIELKEIDRPEVRPGAVLLKVRACAVCGSDLRIMDHGNPRVQPPQVIGHEIAGEIVEVGEDVTKFAPSDRVAVGADVPCGACTFCQDGMGNNCPTNHAMGYQFPGGFQEFVRLEPMVVNYGPVSPIPEGLDFAEASLAEPLACAINGLELSQMGVGKSILVIGAGPLGCMMVELARHMGASLIILAQRSKARLEMARAFPADHFVSTEEADLVEAVRALTDGEGTDVVVTACGSVEAHEQAIEIVRRRGHVNLFGGLPAGSRNLDVASNTIHYKECFVHGSHGSVPRQHRAALALIARGVVRAKRYITHRFPLTKIHDAFEAHRSRQALKVVVEP